MDAAVVDWYILFFSHTDGMMLYKLLREQGFGIRISPAPRAASVCCGMSLLVEAAEIEAVRQATERSGVRYDRIVSLPRQIDPHRDVYC